MYRKAPKGWAKHWDFILFDELALLISFIAAYYIRNGAFFSFGSNMYRTILYVYLLANLAVATLFNTFSGVLKRTRHHVLMDTVRHTTLVVLFLALFLFFTHTTSRYSRIVVFSTYGFHTILGYLFRLIYRRTGFSNHQTRSLFLVTTSDRVYYTIEKIKKDITGTIRISGIALVDTDMTGEYILEIPVFANAETVANYLAREWVDEIFFGVPREDKNYEKLYSSFMEMGITLHVDLGNLTVYHEQKQEVEKIGKTVVLTTSIKTISGISALIKRLMDLAGGLIGSVMTMIILAIVAYPLKKKSPGPLLYTSERIGLNGKRFRMYKIRSMVPDADQQKKELMKDNCIKDGMMFRLEWDPRIIGNEILPDGTHKTGIGEFLRSTSLDEFPQFFNVLKGDMSLVGTRPPTPDEWEKYEPHHRARMCTKPGMTGMWQANGRSEITDFEEVVRLDTKYITNWSIWLDIKLLLKTIVIVIRKTGAKKSV